MTSEVFFGPVDSRCKKAKLEALAQALGLDPLPSTVLTLVSSIKKHLAKHPELAQVPQFQGLFVYRTKNSISQHQAKKSTDKVAEDLAEDSKGAGTVSGAYKTLLDTKYTTDPPAQHVRLDSDVKINEIEVNFADGDGDSVSSSSEYVDDKSQPPQEADSDKDAPVLEEKLPSLGLPVTPVRRKTTDEKQTAHLVVVNFQQKGIDHSVAQEVLVQADESMVFAEESDGHKAFKVSLSLLLPRAIEQLSPQKAPDTRVLRPGIITKDSHIQLGSIGAFLSGSKPRSLDISLVDQYPLQMKDGLLICDLFLEERDVPIKQIRTATPAVTPTKPLDLARLRKDVREVKEGLKTPRKRAAFIDNDAGFTSFLRTLLEVKPRPVRADNIGIVLDRYLALEGGYKKLVSMNWGRSKGGYRVPSGHPSYSGQEFTKTHVQQAFEIQPTLASNDAALFDPSKLINCPDILAWIEDPNGEHKAKFARMTSKTFKEYIAKQDEQAKLRLRDADAHARKKAARKERKRQEREERDEADERANKKKKRSAGYDSDRLDD